MVYVSPVLRTILHNHKTYSQHSLALSSLTHATLTGPLQNLKAMNSIGIDEIIGRIDLERKKLELEKLKKAEEYKERERELILRRELAIKLHGNNIPLDLESTYASTSTLVPYTQDHSVELLLDRKNSNMTSADLKNNEENIDNEKLIRTISEQGNEGDPARLRVKHNNTVNRRQIKSMVDELDSFEKDRKSDDEDDNLTERPNETRRSSDNLEDENIESCPSKVEIMNASSMQDSFSPLKFLHKHNSFHNHELARREKSISKVNRSNTTTAPKGDITYKDSYPLPDTSNETRAESNMTLNTLKSAAQTIETSAFTESKFTRVTRESVTQMTQGITRPQSMLMDGQAIPLDFCSNDGTNFTERLTYVSNNFGANATQSINVNEDDITDSSKTNEHDESIDESLNENTADILDNPIMSTIHSELNYHTQKPCRLPGNLPMKENNQPKDYNEPSTFHSILELERNMTLNSLDPYPSFCQNETENQSLAPQRMEMAIGNTMYDGLDDESTYVDRTQTMSPLQDHQYSKSENFRPSIENALPNRASNSAPPNSPRIPERVSLYNQKRFQNRMLSKQPPVVEEDEDINSYDCPKTLLTNTSNQEDSSDTINSIIHNNKSQMSVVERTLTDVEQIEELQKKIDEMKIKQKNLQQQNQQKQELHQQQHPKQASQHTETHKTPANRQQSFDTLMIDMTEHCGSAKMLELDKTRPTIASTLCGHDSIELTSNSINYMEDLHEENESPMLLRETLSEQHLLQSMQSSPDVPHNSHFDNATKYPENDLEAPVSPNPLSSNHLRFGLSC